SGHSRDLHSFPTRRSSDLWYKGERGFAATAFTTFSYAAAALHLGPALAPATRALLGEALGPAAAWLVRHDDLVKVNHEVVGAARSEEHTSELQSPDHLVCR